MKQEPSDTAAQEKSYYLPPSRNHLTRHWSDRQNRQDDYAQQCVRGHTIIANRIIEGQENGKPPTLEELYWLAARIRRTMAENLAKTYKEDRIHYGYPLSEGITINTPVRQNHADENPYARYFTPAYRQFERLENAIKQSPQVSSNKTDETSSTTHDVAQLHGDGFKATLWQRDDSERAITIHHPDIEGHVSRIYYVDRPEDFDSIFNGDDGKSLEFRHSADRAFFFNSANAHFQKILTNPNAEDFWKELSGVSLDLYHSAPLMRGTQTTNLMVVGGIMKAMGYTPDKRRDLTSQFLKAELWPYKQYPELFKKGFYALPKQGAIPNVAFPADEQFIADAWKETSKYYHAVKDSAKRAEMFINSRWSGSTPGREVTVTSCAIHDGKLKLIVTPKYEGDAAQLQKSLDQFIDRVGHDEMIACLGFELSGPDVTSSAAKLHTDRIPPRGTQVGRG